MGRHQVEHATQRMAGGVELRTARKKVQNNVEVVVHDPHRRVEPHDPEDDPDVEELEAPDRDDVLAVVPPRMPPRGTAVHEKVS